VTREAALAALLRGKLEHGLLGGIAPRENRIELGAPGEPEILVSLPPPGRTDNDVRYPIALLGKRGLLTSDSTRIDGLVSVTDVATGRLRVVPDDDPAQTLEQLDRRIERNSNWRLPLTIALAALLIALALVRPKYALRALLVALAASLWLSPLLALAAGLAVLLLPLGWACAAILLAYLVSMGIDGRRSRSPFAPHSPRPPDQQPARRCCPPARPRCRRPSGALDPRRGAGLRHDPRTASAPTRHRRPRSRLPRPLRSRAPPARAARRLVAMAINAQVRLEQRDRPEAHTRRYRSKTERRALARDIVDRSSPSAPQRASRHGSPLVSW
jgi:hypothetical protein